MPTKAKQLRFVNQYLHSINDGNVRRDGQIIGGPAACQNRWYGSGDHCWKGDKRVCVPPVPPEG